MAYRSPSWAVGLSCASLNRTSKTGGGSRGRKDFLLRGPTIRSFDGGSHHTYDLMRRSDVVIRKADEIAIRFRPCLHDFVSASLRYRERLRHNFITLHASPTAAAIASQKGYCLQPSHPRSRQIVEPPNHNMSARVAESHLSIVLRTYNRRHDRQRIRGIAATATRRIARRECRRAVDQSNTTNRAKAPHAPSSAIAESAYPISRSICGVQPSHGNNP